MKKFYNAPTSGWMYRSSYDWWFVSLYSGHSYRAFVVYFSDGYVNYIHVFYDSGVRPVAYLVSDISFEGNHTVSSSDHYVLSN